MSEYAYIVLLSSKFIFNDSNNLIQPFQFFIPGMLECTQSASVVRLDLVDVEAFVVGFTVG
jgi:hypothetical protein